MGKILNIRTLLAPGVPVVVLFTLAIGIKLGNRSQKEQPVQDFVSAWGQSRDGYSPLSTNARIFADTVSLSS